MPPVSLDSLPRTGTTTLKSSAKRTYSGDEKAVFAESIERLRDQGLTLPQIGRVLSLPAKSLWRWVPPRSAKRPAKVMLDTKDGCWRIYVYQSSREHDPQAGVNWWPVSWMRFDSEQVALDHLKLHGEP